MDESQQVLKLVMQAASKVPGATRPVEVVLRDTGVSFGADFDPEINYGFTVRDAMGDPITIVVYTAGISIAVLAAYDGKLSEVGVGTNLERQKFRRLTVVDVVSFTEQVLDLLGEGVKIAKALKDVRVSSTYDYNRS